MSWGKADLELIRLYKGLDGADARPCGKEEAGRVVCCRSPLHSEAIAHDRRDAHLAAWQSIWIMSQQLQMMLQFAPERILFCMYWTQWWTRVATACSWLLTTAAAEVTYANDHSIQISEKLLLKECLLKECQAVLPL